MSLWPSESESHEIVAEVAEQLRKSNLEIDRLRAQNAALVKALEFYAEADRYNYDETCVWAGGRALSKRRMRELRTGILEDGGEVAVTALRQAKGGEG